MLKKIVFILLITLVSSSSCYALEYYFRSAKKAEAAGDSETALKFYNKVLEQFPYNTKAVLKAYDQMLDIYSLKKDDGKINELLSQLKSNYPNGTYDMKDIEKLSYIYSRYGMDEDALALQWKIVNEPYSSVHVKTILRSYARLLKHHAGKKDEKGVAQLLKKIKSVDVSDLDDQDIYKYAMLYLKYGEKSEATKIMKNIVSDRPHSNAARKALFVLAEEAQKANEYEVAIGYYTVYIERYPDNTFFVQKAYQRIVDIYIAKGDKTLSEEVMRQTADFVNGVSDYKSQLNLAIDLRFKGMNELAEATFNTGYNDAKKVITENPGTYDAIKAYLEIQRAAYPFGKLDIVEQAAKATLSEFKNLEGDKQTKEDADFIKSQAYLWLARTYREQERFDDAIKMLEDFLATYPAHKDKDYALYELGRAYEKNGGSEKAKGFYRAVKSEPLKSEAEKRLAEMQ